LPAAELPTEWKNVQTLPLPRAGLIKLSVPLETLSAARPGLEDVRLYDSEGIEVPCLLEQTAPIQPAVRAAQQFKVAVTADATVATLETGFAEPIASITLQTPANNFFKAVRVEGSQNGNDWALLAQGQPVFRQPGGAGELEVTIPPGRWAFLRLTLDDRRASPIPLLGTLLHAEAGARAPEEPLGVTLLRRSEEPGLTRLALRFEGANITLAGLSVETPDPLFTRAVALAQSQWIEDEVREAVFHRDSIFRVALAERPPAARLRFASGVPLHEREISLLITNDDNPPLQIEALRAWRRPVHLTFNAPAAGVFRLLSGNATCAAPRYELAALRANLQGVSLVPVSPGMLALNPRHRPSDPLADIQAAGSPLDVEKWACRRPLPIERDGVQRVELDLEVLARSAPGLRDLRVVREGRQLPFVLEYPPVQRSFSPPLTRADDPKQPGMSRWQITLPLPGAPISKLTFTTPASYFKREARLIETRRDERGSSHRVILGSAVWMRASGEQPRPLTLALSSVPESDTLHLEIDNGDNPALDLQAAQAWHPLARLIFKSTSAPGTWLYYGNPEARRPQYDLELVVRRLLAADQNEVKPGAEEILKPGARRRAGTPGGWIFWGALALVVVGLLVILTRLLPKSSPTPA
jgi:hypothetical protein